MKQWSHLPVIVDPSHSTGVRELVIPMSRAAIAAGADGLIIEIHNYPEEVFSDSPQSLRPLEFVEYIKEVKKIAEAMGGAYKNNQDKVALHYLSSLSNNKFLIKRIIKRFAHHIFAHLIIKT